MDMKNNKLIIDTKAIENRIFTIRGFQVMLDRDLSELYQVPTKRLNEQVKRNIERFPEQFRFQLTQDEKSELVANCDRFENLKHSTSLPNAFTEQGVAMLSAVLRSETAVQVSIRIMEAFVAMRKFIATNAEVFQRLGRVERKQLEVDKKFEQIFDAIESKEICAKQGIFFDGQVFDAYSFVADLIRSAGRSIVLIDNYIDDTVLTLFSKRRKGVLLTIVTKTVSKRLKLDIKKFNEQYPPVTVNEFGNSHDRFLIIDDSMIYHFGASLKDLGKKWFAFSKMDIGAVEMLGKLEKLTKVKIDG
jgi:hypothetical protein